MPGVFVAGVVAIALLAACDGGSGRESADKAPPVPPGFKVSDTPYWEFAYPADWTTEESRGKFGEHILSLVGPQVTPRQRCAATASWREDYRDDLVEHTRALRLPGDDAPEIITDEEFRAPGASQALRVEQVYQDIAADHSSVQVRSQELYFLRDDAVAISFGVATPADRGNACMGNEILKSFRMKPAAD